MSWEGVLKRKPTTIEEKVVDYAKRVPEFTLNSIMQDLNIRRKPKYVRNILQGNANIKENKRLSRATSSGIASKQTIYSWIDELKKDQKTLDDYFINQRTLTGEEMSVLKPDNPATKVQDKKIEQQKREKEKEDIRTFAQRKEERQKREAEARQKKLRDAADKEGQRRL